MHGEVFVIDDCSRDHSVQPIQEYIRTHSDAGVTLQANQTNRGLATNFVEGAFLGTGKYYRLCCGDNSETTPILVNIFRHLGEADLVIPYQRQREVVGKSVFRRLVSWTFTKLVNVISGYNLKYYNGSAIYLRHSVMRWPPSSYAFGFQADLTRPGVQPRRSARSLAAIAGAVRPYRPNMLAWLP